MDNSVMIVGKGGSRSINGDGKYNFKKEKNNKKNKNVKRL